MKRRAVTDGEDAVDAAGVPGEVKTLPRRKPRRLNQKPSSERCRDSRQNLGQWAFLRR
ncbi:MAG: hypothetical protein ACJ0HO_03980 [Candidatus Thalassarchaeum sp.]